MFKAKITTAQKAEIIRLTKAGYNPSRIAAAIGMYSTSVRYWQTKLDILPAGKLPYGKTRKTRKTRKAASEPRYSISKIHLDHIETWAREDGLTFDEVVGQMVKAEVRRRSAGYSP